MSARRSLPMSWIWKILLFETLYGIIRESEQSNLSFLVWQERHQDDEVTRWLAFNSCGPLIVVLLRAIQWIIRTNRWSQSQIPSCYVVAVNIHLSCKRKKHKRESGIHSHTSLFMPSTRVRRHTRSWRRQPLFRVISVNLTEVFLMAYWKCCLLLDTDVTTVLPCQQWWWIQARNEVINPFILLRHHSFHLRQGKAYHMLDFDMLVGAWCSNV